MVISLPTHCDPGRGGTPLFELITKLTSVFHASVDHEFRLNIVKVAVGPQGDSQVDPGGGGGEVRNKVLYREAPPQGPTPYPFIYYFGRKGTSFIYLLLKKGTPFTYLF